MTFEEQFVGMKNTNWNLPVDEDYIKEEITLHCLDKQRVQEAITKHDKCIKRVDKICHLGLSQHCHVNILYELGLEDEE